MNVTVTGINEKLKKARISLKDTLAIMEMTLEDQMEKSATSSPFEVFEGLNELIDRTVHGTKIERFRPLDGRRPFHTFEVLTEKGEELGYLNMIYLRRPIPCYYLVYAEVLSPFRGRGLGRKTLKAFKEFAEDRGAIGLLDNIIPPNEPGSRIYTKLGWIPIEEKIGKDSVNGEGNYMIFIPASIKTSGLRDKLVKLLFKVKKKRAVIDMHDNESMVKRTIEEFRSVYKALRRVFDAELSAGISTPLMGFMFTKFVTKVLGFRRRISTLLGYTGGESLEQISISNRIKALSIQPYSLWELKEGQTEIWGEEEILRNLPVELKKEPTLYIENLPIYRRPYFLQWVERKGGGRQGNLKIGDILELGFDPTKLRGFRLEGEEYIFERTSPSFLASIKKRRRFLMKIAKPVREVRFHNSTVKVNPPLAIFQDRGNVYVLRRKVQGIHLEEALDQLRTSANLKEMNQATGIDRVLVRTTNEIREWLMEMFDSANHDEIEGLTFFVPWDLKKNIPNVSIDVTGLLFETIWIA